MNEVYAREFQEARVAVDRSIKCPDVAAVAMVLIWLYWSRRPDLAITHHVRYGIRQALCGRDLPGIGASCTDTWEQATNWGGAAMAGLADPSPGPDRLVEAAELYQVWVAGLNARQAETLDLYEAGLKGIDVAKQLGLTPGRASQIKASAEAQWNELDE